MRAIPITTLLLLTPLPAQDATPKSNPPASRPATPTPTQQAQDATPKSNLPAPVLRVADHESLGKKLQAWFDAYVGLVDLENDSKKPASPRQKDDLRKKLEKAKKTFEEEMDKAAKTTKQPSVLKNIADTKAIFSHGFSYKAINGGLFTTRKVAMDKEQLEVGLWLPKSYNPKAAYPMVLSLPFRASDNKGWAQGNKHLESLWGKAPFLEQVVLVAPAFPKDMVLDQPLGTDPKEDNRERDRNGHVLVPMGNVFTDCHIDTNRVVLECSKSNCLAALRVASYFPHRFAGIVVRDPADLTTILPENFRQLPILFVVSGDTEKNADAFLTRLEAAGTKQSKKLKAQGSFPFAEDNPEIAAWMLKCEREPFPREITLVPTHQRYTKVFWVAIDKCDTIATAKPEERPRLEAKIDRATNRFIITTQGVDSFSLLVNDALVDLDKPISVFVNGEPVWKGTKERSLDDVAGGVLRVGDPNWLYVREIKNLAVPKVKKEETQGDKKDDDKKDPPKVGDEKKDDDKKAKPKEGDKKGPSGKEGGK